LKSYILTDLPPKNSTSGSWSSLVIDPPRKTEPQEAGNFGVADDPDHDLAIVKLDHNPFTQPSGIIINGVDPATPHHVAALCPRTITLRAGDPVFTVGYPLGEKRAITTAGIVASSHPNDFDAQAN
jgi:hypothetical protein